MALTLVKLKEAPFEAEVSMEKRGLRVSLYNYKTVHSTGRADLWRGGFSTGSAVGGVDWYASKKV